MGSNQLSALSTRHSDKHAEASLVPNISKQLRWLPTDEVDGDDAKPSKAFLSCVAKHGVIVPLLVTKVDERYVVVAGRRRLKAAQAAQLPKIPCLVFEDQGEHLGELSAAAYALMENIHRSRNVASELRAMRTLADRHLTDDEMQSILGLPKRDFTKLGKLLGLLPRFIEILEEGLMAPTTAAIVASLSKADQLLLIESLEPDQRVTLDQARAFRLKTQYGASQLSFLSNVLPQIEVPTWQ